MASFGFSKRVSEPHAPEILPQLDVRYFLAAGHARPALVEVRAHAAACRVHRVATPPSYRVLTLTPPAVLKQWASQGVRFALAGSGAIQVWLHDRLLASECEAECTTHGPRRLMPDEIQYLDAYMAFTGRRWSEPRPCTAPAKP